MRGRDTLTTARLIAVGVFTAEVVVLAASGLWLIFFYRPSQAQAWSGFANLDTSAGAVGLVRPLHRVAAFIAIPCALVAGVLVVVDSRVRRPGWRQGRLAFGAGPVLVVVTLAAWFTGYLLPWDQLALFAVTVGTNMSGFGFLFESTVKFALVGGTEVTTSTLLRWFLVHTVALSVLLAGALFVAWRPRRRETAPSDAVGETSGAGTRRASWVG